MASSARIDELTKKFDENPRRYFAPLANEYRKAGEVERAIQLCREYLPQQPLHMSGHIVFGQALFEAGEFDEARAVFEQALALDPENLIALRHLGDIARDGGDTESARHWYQRVLDADPRNDEIATQIAALGGAQAASSSSASAATEMIVPSWDAPSESDAGPSATWLPDAAFNIAADEPTTDTARDDASESPWSATATPAAPRAAEPMDLDLSALDFAAPATPGADAPTAQAPVDTEWLNLDAGATDERTSPSAETPDSYDDGSSAPATADSVSTDDWNADADDDARAELRDEAPRAVSQPHAMPAAQPSHDELGLEVMEFVPPPRGAVETATGLTSFQIAGENEDAPAAARTPTAFVTETMAELYLQQGFDAAALDVYRQLSEQNPADASLRERVAQLERGASSSVSAAAVSEEVVSAARQRQTARAPRTVRDFLEGIATRRARGGRGPEHDPSGGGGGSPYDAVTEEFATYDAEVVEAAADEQTGAELSADAALEPATLDYIADAEFGAVDLDAAAGDSRGGELRDDSSHALPDDAMAYDAPDYGSVMSSDDVPASSDGASTDSAAMWDTGAYEESEALRTVSGDEATASDAADEVLGFDIASPIADVPPAEHSRSATPAAGASLDALFGGGSVSRADEAAAAMLSGAYAPVSDTSGAANGMMSTFLDAPAGTPPSSTSAIVPPAARPTAATTTGSSDAVGRATRPAASELSLDHVFRETPRRGSESARRDTGAFSFDQFFAQTAAPQTDAPRAASPHEPSAASGEPPAGADIEQFNAWLDGLKKK